MSGEISKPKRLESAVEPARRNRDLSPAVLVQRLDPYSVVDTGTLTIWYFLKISARASAGSVRHLSRDPSIARKCAMISHKRGAATFTLQWYPHDDQPQIVKDLPLSMLGQAVEDLKGAGF